MYKKKATAISLPQSKTAKIMTSAVGVESVNPDIVALATKATEIFLQDFACRAYDQSSDEEFRSNVLEYDDIQKLVHSDSRYDFLIDTTPKRIKFSEALKLVDEANLKRQEQEQVNQERAMIKKQQKSQKAAAKKSEEATTAKSKQESQENERGEPEDSHDSKHEQEEEEERDLYEEVNEEDHQVVDEENKGMHTEESEHSE